MNRYLIAATLVTLLAVSAAVETAEAAAPTLVGGVIQGSYSSLTCNTTCTFTIATNVSAGDVFVFNVLTGSGSFGVSHCQLSDGTNTDTDALGGVFGNGGVATGKMAVCYIVLAHNFTSSGPTTTAQITVSGSTNVTGTAVAFHNVTASPLDATASTETVNGGATTAVTITSGPRAQANQAALFCVGASTLTTPSGDTITGPTFAASGVLNAVGRSRCAYGTIDTTGTTTAITYAFTNTASSVFGGQFAVFNGSGGGGTNHNQLPMTGAGFLPGPLGHIKPWDLWKQENDLDE